jgi:hypothetical protein
MFRLSLGWEAGMSLTRRSEIGERPTVTLNIG